MTFEQKCEVENKIIDMFNAAIVNPDNLDADEVDGINWNFVDADIWIGVQEAGLEFDHIDLGDFVEGMINEYLEFGEVEKN